MLKRPRRLRRNSFIRDLVQEVSFSKDDLIAPFFIIEKGFYEIPSLPGIYYYDQDHLIKELNELVGKGLKSILLFPKIEPSLRTSDAAFAYKKNFFYQTVQFVKKNFPELILMVDIALDPYTDHAHDGILIHQDVDNDLTLDYLSKLSLHFAEAGADVLSPSDMMDGRVKRIRQDLDLQNFSNRLIMSYSCKYASSLYGPFRQALEANLLGDKKTYQLNVTQKRESLKEALLDEEEGADLLLIKPASWYLDIISLVKEKSLLPIVAYHTSGEYLMIKNASSEKDLLKELLFCLKRAGADLIITYYASSLIKEH